MRTYHFVGVALLAALCVGTAWVLGTGVVVHVAGPAVPPAFQAGGTIVTGGVFKPKTGTQNWGQSALLKSALIPVSDCFGRFIT